MRLLNVLSNAISPYKFIIIIVIIIAIFLGFSVYAYQRYNSSTTGATVDPKFKDVANNGQSNGEIDIMMFHVDWCPHCVKALPEWKSFCDTYNGTNVNGYTISCSSAGSDCTADQDPVVQGWLRQYSITSFPTVILIKNSQVYNYDATITKNSLEQFLQTVSVSS